MKNMISNNDINLPEYEGFLQDDPQSIANDGSNQNPSR